MISAEVPSILWWGADFNVICNAAALDLLPPDSRPIQGHPASRSCPELWKRAGADIRSSSLERTAKRTQSYPTRRMPVSLLHTPVQEESGTVAAILTQFVHIPSPDEPELRSASQVLRTIRDGVYALDAGFRFTYLNPAAEANAGTTRQVLLGQSVWEAFPWIQGTDLERSLRRVMETRNPEVFEFSIQSSGKWFEERIYPAYDGGITAHYRDITNQKHEAEERIKTEQQLALLADAARTLMLSPDSETVLPAVINIAQRFIAADAYAFWRRKEVDADLWQIECASGLSADFQTAFQGNTSDYRLPDEPFAIEEIHQSGLLPFHIRQMEREGIHAMLVAPLWIHGEKSGTLVFYYRSPTHFTGQVKTLAAALANLAAAAIGTAEVYDRQTVLRARAQQAEQRARFLADAGDVFSSSLDPQVTLQSVARLAVPAFADWCSVELVDVSGHIEQVAIEHVDPDKVRLAYDFIQKYSSGEDDTMRGALRSGKTAYLTDIPDAFLTEKAQDDQHREIMRKLGLKSFIVTPLTARGRVLGVLAFVTAESGRRYTDADIEFAEEIARRAATAVDNARLHQEAIQSERRVQQLNIDLRRLVREFETLFQAIPAGVGVAVDPLCHRIRPNPTLAAMLGISPAEDITHTNYVGGTLPFRLFASGAEVASDDLVMYTAARQAREVRSVEYEILRRDGSQVSVLAYATPLLDEDGSVRGCIGVFLDITERTEAERALRESEERFRAMANHSPVMIWVAGRDRLCNWFNEPWLAFTGRPMEHEVNYGWIEGIHPEDQSRCAAVYSRAFDSRQPFVMDYRLRRHDGEFRWVAHHGVPRFDPSGTFSGYIGSCIDITERKNTEAALEASNLQLQRINTELRRANADLEQFAYSASHDLREPLRVVAIYSDIIRQRYAGTLDDQGKIYFGYMADAARRMEMLVRDILIFTQIGSEPGDTPLVADAGAALRESLAALDEVIRSTGATVRYAAMPSVAMAQPHLQQIFHNLVGNALKYRSAEPPLIEISSARQPDGRWLFRVADNGLGIDPDYKDYIFGLFKRLHPSSEYSGTGIGLAICRRIAERYGCSIWVEPAPAKGSVFCFTAPSLT